ncbi:MAG: hypothetical protein ACODAU_00315 [Myxococcota bacterium]
MPRTRLSSPTGWTVLFVCSLAAPDAVRAQGLHVYGPAGSGRERRALVVQRTAEGTCVPADALALAVAPTATLELQEPAGPCARWVRVVRKEGRGAVPLQSPDGEARTDVDMGHDVDLDVTARRRGSVLEVRVEGAPAGSKIAATAHWAGGRIELTPLESGAHAGRVPPNALVGVVARATGRVGVAASPAAGNTAPKGSALVLPALEWLPGGGAPRTAAFVVTADRRGRLSRHVPLRISGDGARLRGLEWLDDGVAAVRLQPESGSDRVRLRVVAAGAAEPIHLEIPVAWDWPVSAVLDLEPTAEVDRPFRVALRAQDAGGEPVAADRARVRCPGAVQDGGSLAEPTHPTRCVATEEGAWPVVAEARVGEAWVPLAARTVEVGPAPVEPEPAPPEPPTEVSPPPSEPETPEEEGDVPVLAGYGHAGVDTWRRASVGGGVRVRGGPWEWLRLGATVRYAATPFTAEPADSRVVESLSGTAHELDVLAEATARLSLGTHALLGRIGLGPTWRRDRSTVGQREDIGDAVGLTASLAAGPVFWFGKLGLEATVGVRWQAVDQRSPAAWPQAPARFFLEVGGVLAP